MGDRAKSFRNLKEIDGWGIIMFVRATSPERSVATRASLLVRLKDHEDHGSWQEFFDTYWQLIHRVALKSGLTQTEAQDAVQETVLAVAKHIKGFEYDPSRCSFKSWLMLITRQRIIWQLRKRLPSHPINDRTNTSRTSTVDRIPDPNAVDLDSVWEDEWQKNLITAALERVKRQVNARQFQIFDLYVLQNWPANEVARTLKINVARVYLAKHRVAALLTKEVQCLQREGDPFRRKRE
jgi:RNA polymerase sigma factor (sigma-70 family)